MEQYDFILIGGGSSSGKSVLARRLADKLGYDLLAVDDFRIAIQQVVGREHLVNYFLQGSVFENDISELIKKHEEVSKIVCKAIEAVIGHNVYIKNPIILEGDDLLPAFVIDMLKKYSKGKAIFIYQLDGQIIKKNILTRARHTDDLTEEKLKKQVDFIVEDNIRIKSQAEYYNLTTISANPYESLFNRVCGKLGI